MHPSSPRVHSENRAIARDARGSIAPAQRQPQLSLTVMLRIHQRASMRTHGVRSTLGLGVATSAGSLSRPAHQELRIRSRMGSFAMLTKKGCVLASAASIEDEAIGAVPERRTDKWRSR
jgi:hypothetical protein